MNTLTANLFLHKRELMLPLVEYQALFAMFLGPRTFFEIYTCWSQMGLAWFRLIYLYVVHCLRRPFGDFSELKHLVSLPVGESNPGLPRDRRGYSPLY